MKGQQCKLSKLAVENHIGLSKNRDRTGVITGESRDKTCWNVRWEGTKTPTAYAKEYITTDLSITHNKDKLHDIRCILNNFVQTFADCEDGEWWGHDTNLGTCEEAFEHTSKELLKLINN